MRHALLNHSPSPSSFSVRSPFKSLLENQTLILSNIVRNWCVRNFDFASISDDLLICFRSFISTFCLMMAKLSLSKKRWKQMDELALPSLVRKSIRFRTQHVRCAGQCGQHWRIHRTEKNSQIHPLSRASYVFCTFTSGSVFEMDLFTCSDKAGQSRTKQFNRIEVN